jgi:CBS domain containing-hemolysin-like protein
MKHRGKNFDDSGATLAIALILVIVISVVLTAVLSYTGASLNTTERLRGLANAASAADSAAQVKVNQLRNDKDYCKTLPITQPVAGLYPSPLSTSVAVTCTPEPLSAASAASGAPNLPGSVLVTLTVVTVRIVYLDVCPGQTTCNSSTAKLRAKIRVVLTTPRTAIVLSWSEIR